ncbi:MAG: cupredoxin domain-containing protein [Nitrospirae bacterium]|nr:cupredoxin domain-containing protein [Nitrospirota bacterium]
MARILSFLLVAALLPLPSIPAANPFAVEVPLAADGVQRAVVEADSYDFAPRHLVVWAGRPVELTFKSLTWLVPHNIIIDDPRSGLAVREEIRAGESVTVRFTPMVPGTFAIYCDKKLPFFKSHREKGMEGVLEVR